jgi:branched-chain amino acid transport system substrate-binding protein
MWGIVVMVVALVAAGAFFAWKIFYKSSPTTSTTQRTIKVGVLAPLTGDNLSIGNGIRRAVQLARKDLDLQDVDIQVIEKDSNCEAKTAEAAAKELIAQKVVAIIGDYCSSSTLAVLKLAAAAKVVVISPAATSPDLSGSSPYFFRTVPTDVQQGEFAAKTVTQKGYTKIAILHDDDAYGIGLSKSFADSVSKLGGSVVANEVFPAEGIDVNAQLDRIKASKAQALYIISVSLTSDRAILEGIRSKGITSAIYGSEALKDQTFIDDEGVAAEGMTVTALPDGSAVFLDNFRAEFNAAPATYTAQTYDAYLAIAKAIAAGAGTGDEIKKSLASLRFTGAVSEVSFNAQGDIANGTFDVVTVKDGKYISAGQ